MKLGLYGGSFDPIHNGHLGPVKEARDVLGLDRVIYLPTARPPHKLHRKAASAMARFTMVELALLDETALFVSPLELVDRVTYTVEALEHFRRHQPDDDLVLILGRDSLVQLDSWRQWRRILQLADIAVLERPANDERQPSPELREALEATRIHRIGNLPVNVSSTEIRQWIAAGRNDAEPFLPPLVLNYIEKYDLYR